MGVKDGDRYMLYARGSGSRFAVECVVSEEARKQGLSGRASLQRGTGMLFMFPDIAVQSMWMPDMQFPLDIVWLDEQLVVVHRTLGAPPCASKAECSSYSSKFRIKYAIELNAGDADALGLDVGTVLRVA